MSDEPLFDPLTAREGLLAIQRECGLVHSDSDVFEVALKINGIAVAGLNRRGPQNYELSDSLADRLAEAHRVLIELRDGGADIARLSGEIDEALALPPDIEAMIDRRLHSVPDHVSAIAISISIEGAKSFASDSSGWGAIGYQEIEEAVTAALKARGIEPPYRPEKKPE